MKSSKYNYFIPFMNDRYIIFNGLTKRFFIIDDEYLDMYKNVISNPDDYCTKFPQLHEKLSINGFIVSNKTDEVSIIESIFNKIIRKPHYTLMILPTYSCNFSCWYCVQHHVNESMDNDVVDRIKMHIETYLTENNISSFEIAWFGGEPLLHPEIINNIASFAKDVCEKRQITFHNTITTNGYLITEELLEMMKKYNFTSYQITIDGAREQHNKVRKSNNELSFDVILENIIRILDCFEDIHVVLRFNYTTENIADTKMVEDINKCISENYRPRIEILMRKVWQVDEHLIDSNAVASIREAFIRSGYKMDNAIDIGSFQSCYTENIHFNTIFHNGRVDKCSNIKLDKAKGYLDNEGRIKLETGSTFIPHNIFSIKSPCKKCKYLPVCMGPCPVEREKSNNIQCLYKDKETKKTYIEKMVINYCNSHL